MIESVLRPTTVQDCLALAGAGTAVLAGGTDLVPMHRAGALGATRLVDLSGIEELTGVRSDPSGTHLGSMATAAQVAARVDGAHAAVADGAGLIGSRQTRNMATVGGNVCRASPSGDTLAPLLVCDARFHLRSAGADRVVRAADFFVGPGRTVLADDEVLTAIELPVLDGASAYARVTARKAMDLATVGVAVALERAGQDRLELRVGVSGAGPRPLLLPHDGPPVAGDDLQAALPAVDRALQDLISPIDDVRASAWYRRRAVSILLRRMVAIALTRLDRHPTGLDRQLDRHEERNP